MPDVFFCHIAEVVGITEEVVSVARAQKIQILRRREERRERREERGKRREERGERNQAGLVPPRVKPRRRRT